MAEIPFDDILSDKLFKFLVGPEKKEFFIHASLLASHSDVLEALVHGSMTEAVEDCAVWEHVDVATFVRFGQYLYTGNYEGEAPSQRNKIEELMKVATNADESDSEPEHCDEDFEPVYPSEKDSPQSKFKSQVPVFSRLFERKHVPGDKGPLVSYRDVLISHARMHVFAEYYEVIALADFALKYLHEILCKLILCKERVPDLMALLRYCYEEDDRPYLRELVSEYAAYCAKPLWRFSEFRELLEQEAALAAAVMGNVIERVD